MIVFITIAIAGLILLLVTALLGGDHDFSAHEVSFEQGYEPGGDHLMETGPSPFSLRVISLFAVTFGAIGAISRHYEWSLPMSCIFGVIGGIIVGTGGWGLMKVFWRQQASSTVSSQDIIDSSGEVKTAIPASGIGQISIVVKNQLRYLAARSEDGGAIEEGAIVRIIDCQGGNMAIVKKIQH